MEKAKSELAKADVEYIDQNIAYLKEHEEDMLGDLSCLINLVTLLPICETEYAEEAQTFRNYDYVFEVFNRLEECLETFDMQLLLPQNVYEYYGVGESKLIKFRNQNSKNTRMR